MLPKSVIKDIRNEVDDVYDRIKARFLNEKYKKKGIEFTFRNDTLEDFFRDIAEREGVEPDKDTLATLKEVAGSYLDASRERAKAQVIQAVQAVIRESVLSGETPNVRVAIQGQMSKIWGDATTHVHAILDSEVNTAKNVSILEGITQYNAKVGVDDPVVFFIIVRDGAVCSECVRLHMMPDGVTPRLWYMSEVGSGYHKKGDPNPKISGLHPHCRCQMSTLLLGYGFNASGKVTYVAKDHSEIDKQRGMTKSEGLAKSTRVTLASGIWDRIKKHVDKWSKLRYTNDPHDQEYIDKANIAVHVPMHALEDIFDDGRIKNQFETNRSQGALDPSYRSEVENDLFGIDMEEDGEVRPIYGALHTNGVDHSSNGRLSNWHEGPATNYGRVWFELRPEVKQRSTFCDGDSLNNHSDGNWQGTVFTHPNAVNHMDISGNHLYTEAQIHGGVYLDKDVQAVHFSSNANQLEPMHESVLKRIGEKYNVPVYFHKSMPHSLGRGIQKVYHSTQTIHQPTEQPLGKSTREILTSGLWNQIKQHVQSGSREHTPTASPEDHAAWKQRLSNAPLVMHFPAHAIADISNSGRLKNQFETNTSRGVLSTARRANVEHDLFGIPHNHTGETRPVYGGLHHTPRTQYDTGLDPHYGNVWLELHPHVKERSTFSSDDSLDMHYRTPTASLDKARAHVHTWPHVLDRIPKNVMNQYVEAQIHGGVHLDNDVKAIHVNVDQWFTEPNSKYLKDVQEMSKRYNLPLVFHGHPDEVKKVQPPPPTRIQRLLSFFKAEEELGKSTRETLTSGLWDRIKEYNISQRDPEDIGGYGTPESRSLIDNSILAVHLPPTALVGLWKDGRLKTQFETGTSKGALDPRYRARSEEELFGIPQDLGGEFRPIYGALHVFHKDSAQPSPRWHEGPARHYGSVWLELHPHVRSRTTLTQGDSLNSFGNRVVQWDKSRYELNPHYKDYGYPYLEAQIHGGVYLGEDVKAIHVRELYGDGTVGPHTTKSRAHLKALGKKYGVPVYFHKSAPRGYNYGSTEVWHDPSAEQQPVAMAKSTRDTLKSGLWDAVQSHVEQKSGLGRINDPDDQNSLNFSQIAINVPKTALAGILKDGRIKNMFESKRSGGMVSENIRKQVEMDMFGIHPDIKPDQRPVYGALQDKTNWMWHRGPSSEYGSFWFDLKPHVKERSTFSAGDTVEMHSRGETDGVYTNRYAHKHMNPEAGDYGYHEAQIHGGVYLDKDVNALHFAKEAQKQTVSPTEMNILLAIGKKYRIPVLFHRSNQHGGYLSTETLYDPSTETKED